MWVTWSTGATPLVLAAGANARLGLFSSLEAEIGHEVERVTITRNIVTLSMSMSNTADGVATLGLIPLQEDVTIGSINPVNQPHADWLWLEEFMVTNSSLPLLQVTRDLRGQRKMRGRDMNYYLYTSNRHGVTSLQYHCFGRTLVILE